MPRKDNTKPNKAPARRKKALGKTLIGPPGKPLVLTFKTVKTVTLSVVGTYGQPGGGSTKPYCSRLAVAGFVELNDGEFQGVLQVLDPALLPQAF